MATACPSTMATEAPRCPMRAAGAGTDSSPAQCPVSRDISAINPRNNMPNLPQSRAPGQSRFLPTTKITSSIPRPPNATSVTYSTVPVGDDGNAPSKWEYPSPQQFYNALVRKGWNTPEEHVVAMVLLHNRLNEDAWAEVLKWETRFGGGASEAAKLELAEFAGIHDRVSHKAWLYQSARHIFPSYLTLSPPFDRHDWIVRRPATNKRVRYVIDYYSSRKSARHEPEFHLDVRPAMDNFGSVSMRLHAQAEKIASRIFGKHFWLLHHLSDALFLICLFVPVVVGSLYLTN